MRTWTLAALSSCLFAAACGSSGQDCGSALDRIADCTAQVCAAGDAAACSLLEEGRRTSLLQPAPLTCDGLTSTEINHLLEIDCASLAQEAVLLAEGKADTPCPNYFPWCTAMAPGNAPFRVNLLSFRDSEVELEVVIPDVGVTRWLKEGSWYSDLFLTGAGRDGAVGQPAIPVVSFLVGVPSTTDTAWLSSVATMDQRQIPDITLIPVQPSVREIDAPPPFARDEASYGLDQNVPDVRGVIGDVATWRNYRVVPVTIHPFRYNAARKILTVDTRTRVQVSFADLEDEPKDTADDGEEASAEAYRTTLVNYPEIRAIDAPQGDDPGRVRLLVIASDPLFDATVPFVQLKERQNIRTELLRLSTVGNTPDQIKAKIADRYAQMAIEAVLLVGDVADLPMFMYPADASEWGSEPIPSDYWYGLLAGEDLLPEVSIGRLPGRTHDEIAAQVAKIIAYEEGDANADWRHKILLVAHEEDAPYKYQACAESVRSRQYHGGPYNFMRLYGGNNASNADVVNQINAGVGVVAYRGHGSNTAWQAWNGGHFSFENSGIQNGDRTPVVFSIACSNLAMQDEARSHGEQWMLANNGGAAAFLGATIPSWTEANDVFMQMIFRILLDDGVSRIGALIDRARVAILSQGFNRANEAVDNVRMYAWLGDPMMDIGTTFEKAPEVRVGWCNLQWPPQMEAIQGAGWVPNAPWTTPQVYGQVWSAGVTEGVGQGNDIQAEIGYGPAGSNPTATPWTWSPAQFNMDKGNNDEYSGFIFSLPDGTYSYTLRFKGSNDADWVYCDQDGSHNGVQVAQLGTLTTPAKPATPSAATESNYPGEWIP